MQANLTEKSLVFEVKFLSIENYTFTTFLLTLNIFKYYNKSQIKVKIYLELSSILYLLTENEIIYLLS